MNKQNDSIQGVWKQHSTQWKQVGSPLRPTEEDTNIMLMFSASAISSSKDISSITIILGVTPEIVQLPWPSNTCLHAYDHSADMIASVWRPHPVIPSFVHQVRWQSMPLSDKSVDLVVGDGCFSVLPSAEEYRAVFAEAARVLKPFGRFVLRFFVRPELSESLEDIVAAVYSGQIGSFHALKWRVAMAIKPDHEFTIAVNDIYATFNKYFPDRTQLAEYTGWPYQAINTIDAYNVKDVRYTFPTMSEINLLLSPYY